MVDGRFTGMINAGAKSWETTLAHHRDVSVCFSLGGCGLFITGCVVGALPHF